MIKGDYFAISLVNLLCPLLCIIEKKVDTEVGNRCISQRHKTEGINEFLDRRCLSWKNFMQNTKKIHDTKYVPEGNTSWLCKLCIKYLV